MKVVRELDEKRWGEFVTEHPHGNIFHTPEMFRVFARAEGFDPTLWAVVADSGRILALMLPVRITALGQLFLRISTRSVVSAVFSAGKVRKERRRSTCCWRNTCGMRTGPLFSPSCAIW